MCVCEALSFGVITPFSLLGTVKGRIRTRVDSERSSGSVRVTTGLRTSSVNHVTDLLAKREPARCTVDSCCNVSSPLQGTSKDSMPRDATA